MFGQKRNETRAMPMDENTVSSAEAPPPSASIETMDAFADQIGATFSGFAKPGFEPVRDAFAANLLGGVDIGASAALFIDGECVVDLAGGYFDASYTRPFARDSLVNTFSTTKTMTALCALVLADRGEIDLDDPVAKYWPEFAANGKRDVLVRDIVGHASGVAGWNEPVTLEDIYDTEKSAALLAAQAPWWAPGTATGYHGLNMGHLVGEVVRRVTGLSLGQFFAREIAEPTAADFFIGTPSACDGRVSPLVQGYPIAPVGNAYFKRSLLNPPTRPQDTWSLAWRRAELGASNGHGSAHGIAAAQAVLANGGVAGRRILSDAGRQAVLRQRCDGVDLVLGAPLKWGVGYSLFAPLGPNPAGASSIFGKRVAWWAGNGGSLSYVDLDARMSFGFAPNRWITGPQEQVRSLSVLKAAYTCLAQNA